VLEKGDGFSPGTARAAVAEVQKSRIMHRTVTNSFAREEELNQQLYAGSTSVKTRMLRFSPVNARTRTFPRPPVGTVMPSWEPLPPGDPADDY
jgi:hypothetical protein